MTLEPVTPAMDPEPVTMRSQKFMHVARTRVPISHLLTLSVTMCVLFFVSFVFFFCLWAKGLK